MNHKLSELVSVNFSFDSTLKKSYPRFVAWRNRVYKVKEIGLHHTFRQGRTLFHVFSVISDTLFMRLTLNTDNLQWELQEVSDYLD